MPPLSIPTKARLLSSLKVPSDNPILYKALVKLSRASLITLALDWLDDRNSAVSQPYLAPSDGSDDGTDSLEFYTPATSIARLREVYLGFQQRKGSKREVLDRILEGDWRHGLTLYQLSMADLQYLYDHPTSQKWVAYGIVPAKPFSENIGENLARTNSLGTCIPRIHPSTFLEHMQSQILPDIKMHFQFDRPHNLRLVILRIFIIDSPYNTSLAISQSNNGTLPFNVDTARTIYVAFPDGAPFVYVSSLLTVGESNAMETRGFRHALFEAIRRALAKPTERYALTATNMATRNLAALLRYRGSGRSNAAGGGWTVYTDEASLDTPLDRTAPPDPLHWSIPKHEGSRLRKRKDSLLVNDFQAAKRSKLAAQARFGHSARIDDGTGVERADMWIQDPYPTLNGQGLSTEDAAEPSDSNAASLAREKRWFSSARQTNHEKRNAGELLGPRNDSQLLSQDDSWSPNIRLALRGTHVFAGIRQLVEAGIIDGERMPGWLTGEDNVTFGVVRDGRVREKGAHGLQTTPS